MNLRRTMAALVALTLILLPSDDGPAQIADGAVELAEVAQIRPRGMTLEEAADASPVDLLAPLRPGYVAPAPPNDDGLVHVRGYYRKDGTYVRPHTRRKQSR